MPAGAAAKRPGVAEVVLPGERLSDAPLAFKVPPLENLAASANRLLKFEFPVTRSQKVFERLLKPNLLSAKLSKKTLEELPVPAIEFAYHAVWQEAFGPDDRTRNELLSLLLLAEELIEFDPVQLVAQDIQWLGTHEAAGLHSYYYSGEISREPLLTLLKENHYRTDFLEAVDSSDTSALRLAYLACRRLTYPLPWVGLLSALDAVMFDRFPQLARLNRLHALLGAEGLYQDPLGPQDFRAVYESMAAFLEGPAAQMAASQCQTSRPVKELIIVEGETEKLLLPLFAESMGADFNALGIFILPAGGKNHVMALYKQHAELLNCPIFVVLDGDATEVVKGLQEVLRPQDFVYQIQEGEFEDTYDLKLILQTINQHYQPYPEVTPSTFTDEALAGQGRVQILKSIWQSYNLGSFDKVEFAGKLAEMIQPNMQPPQATRLLLDTILKVRRGL